MRDLWDEVVGVPLDAWCAASTSAELAALLDARDNPVPAGPRDPIPTGWDEYDILDGLGNIVARHRIPRFDPPVVIDSWPGWVR